MLRLAFIGRKKTSRAREKKFFSFNLVFHAAKAENADENLNYSAVDADEFRARVGGRKR